MLLAAAAFLLVIVVVVVVLAAGHGKAGGAGLTRATSCHTRSLSEGGNSFFIDGWGRFGDAAWRRGRGALGMSGLGGEEL